jgi:hypothetical protein
MDWWSSRSFPWTRRRRRERVQPGDALVPNFAHYFTKRELEQELSEAGFETRHYRPWGPGPYDSGFAVAARGSNSSLRLG